tara:strand:- start:214 stop:738 length:525 start_codon:yes stop_codon:yes gene_type:complete
MKLPILLISGYILVSILIILGIYFITHSVIDKIITYKKEALKLKSRQAITNNQIQAFERMTLFLERLSPGNLLLRLTSSSLSVLELQQILLSEVRQEFNHNAAQQIYISSGTWELVAQAMNEIVTIINQSATELKPEDPAGALSKKILAKVMDLKVQPTENALHAVKKEFSELF